MSRATFREVTIAQGSGLGGFDTIRIFADGRGYAVVGPSESSALCIPFELSAGKMKENGGKAIKLTAGAANDIIELAPESGNMTIREV